MKIVLLLLVIYIKGKLMDNDVKEFLQAFGGFVAVCCIGGLVFTACIIALHIYGVMA